MASFVWDFTQLEHGLNTYGQQVDRLAVVVLEALAPFIEHKAQAEHTWQNRTGAAESGLNAGVEVDAANHIATLYLQHGDIDYGWWLETRWGGRFAIIQPVLEQSYDLVMTSLRKALQ